MKLFRPISVAVSLLAFASCAMEESGKILPTPVVRELLADHSLPAWNILDAADGGKNGSIAIVGAPQRCLAFQKHLIDCDEADNVDGRRVSDGLPDFAGETIAAYLDYANTPYDVYADSANTEFLRELAVRNVIDALDTNCFISPYDREGLGRKLPAKLVVLASPVMSRFGKWDVDTLFRAASCPVKVLCPVEEAFKHVFSQHEGPLTIGVISAKGDIYSEVYGQIFNDVAKSLSRSDSKCFALSVDSQGDLLLNYVDSCLAAGIDGPFDAIVVDDYDADYKAMLSTVERITSVMSEESLTYSRFFNSRFELVDPMCITSRVVHTTLRAMNAFTHNIAYPKSASYMTVFKPDADYPSRFVRAAGLDTDTYMLIQFSERYLPDADSNIPSEKDVPDQY